MYNYTVKVKEEVFLWGSRGVQQTLDGPFYLTIHVDPFGDEVRVTTFDGSSDTDIGTLKPGECWTVPLNGLCGIYGYCETDSVVACAVASLR